MKQAYGISGGALAAALLGMLFCIWTALGNEVAFCVTAGCSLYQDLVIGGLSMWWIGTAAFGVLACLALLGAVPAGHFLAGLTLLGDIFLLLLMALTSPCVSCLVVACFFALTYWLFRRALHRDDRRPQERSLLLCAWLVLFVVNAGQVVRMQGEVWSISENSDQATVRMFFSPSCSACREGIGILSGSVDVAFCPVAENDADVARVERMLLLLEEGKTLKEAVAACRAPGRSCIRGSGACACACSATGPIFSMPVPVRYRFSSITACRPCSKNRPSLRPLPVHRSRSSNFHRPVARRSRTPSCPWNPRWPDSAAALRPARSRRCRTVKNLTRKAGHFIGMPVYPFAKVLP